ncbi:MAG: hypothetical protein ACRD43_06305 [Pyrinomonadaceae bacterium]
MKIYLVFCILLSTAFGARIAVGQETPAGYTDKDAYEIYSALLGEEWPVSVAKAKTLVIQTETVDYPNMGDAMSCLAPAKGKESLFDPVLAAYHKANKSPAFLQRKFDESFTYELVSRDWIKKLFDEKSIGGWKDFYAKYPDSGGIISMSAVGFNVDKTIALVYMGHSCGGLCGGGRYHMLQKTDGKWAEIHWQDISCSWAS